MTTGIDDVLTDLFGIETVQQASLIDAADLNLTDDMTRAIGEGLKHLKDSSGNPQQQKKWISEQQPGLQLLLCLWIMDMDLVSKVTARS